MSDFQRVKDKITQHEYSVRYPDPDQHIVLDEPAVDRNGDPLPATPHTTVATEVTAKQTNGGPSAQKEGSK